MKHISKAAMLKAIKVLKRFGHAAQLMGATVRAVATSAVREALNQAEFIKKVQAKTGIKIEVISGFEEAWLIYLGVIQSLPVFNKKILMVDIGGGSTEFFIGRKAKVHFDDTIKLGAVRLTARYFSRGKISGKEVSQCREYVSGMLSPVARQIKHFDYDLVVGTSGTILAIAKMVEAAKDSQPAPSTNNFYFNRKELSVAINKIVSCHTIKQRQNIPGLDPDREDIITAGALILEGIFKVLNIKRMLVSEYSLKEGLLWDTIQKKSNLRGREYFQDTKAASVLSLAWLCRYEARHSQQVCRLALGIFDQLSGYHGLSEIHRSYLKAAAILHDIGLFLSRSQHHRHSYYLIRNAELLGFTENEKEIIANVARYHRKSHPKLKHEGFSRLNKTDRIMVKKLAAILRIADGLDRGHTCAVSRVLCTIKNKNIFIKAKPKNRKDVWLELWAARQKKGLLENSFRVKVYIRS